MNTALVPNYKDISAFLKDQNSNSKGGKQYGIPHGWGANYLMWKHRRGEARPRLVGRGVRRQLA